MSTQYTIRPLRFADDSPFVDRILNEVGWRRPGDRAEREDARHAFHAACDGFVAELNHEAECFVSTLPGDYRYRSAHLPFTGVTGVVTSRVARKQGLASRTTARALANAAEHGSVLAGLGIFDQGFYDKLGFGTGGYDHFATIDPASLTVPYCERVPVRLTFSDYEEMHAARLARRRVHGSVALYPPETTRLVASHNPLDFGLGFRDEASGELTHHFWVHTENSGSGPYRVLWTSYSTIAQFVELLGLIRNLGDQLYTFWIAEPAGVQIQDFLHRPFRRHQQGRRGEFETHNLATANFQYRILDVERAFTAAAAQTALPPFAMRVTDPVSRYLHEHEGWQGVAGDYRVDASGARRVSEGIREVNVTISVGDLTRAWLGVVPISTLRDTRPLAIDTALAAELDRAFSGPAPRTDWLY
ncbi:MAG: GNAT family N-acetyltransferase [Spirochaetota bacterium]